MPNDPLGISFSPFSQPDQQQGQGPGGGPQGSTPQDAIRILSFRPPRTVGASSPVAAPLLNAPGGQGLGGQGMGGGQQFGAAGGNLEQLLMLLFGPGRRMLPGGGTFNERPPQGQGMDPLSAMFGGGGPTMPQPSPFGGGSAPTPRTTFSGPPGSRPGEEYQGPPPETLTGANGGAYSPPNAGPLPWENGPQQGPGRGDRFV